MRLIPRKWEDFQHYKDRAPPWIKLHHGLLDDSSFQRLPDASRALAPCLWLLASESKGGDFDGSTEELSFRVRQSEKWIEAALKPLIDKGFFIVVQDASKALADCGQVAVPETEAEAEADKETEAETKKTAQAPTFVLPDWINRKHWDAWNNSKKRRGSTVEQKQLAVDKLEAWREEGQDFAGALENAAVGGNQGLFLPSGPARPQQTNKQQALEDRNQAVAREWARGNHAEH